MKLILLLVPRIALADVPPPLDYVEECTRAKQERDDEYCAFRSGGHWDRFGCEARDNPPDFGERCRIGGDGNLDHCCAAVRAAGWHDLRCQTAGASVFNVLWCRPRHPEDPARPIVSPPSLRLVIVAASAAFVIAMVGVVLYLRRRRR